MNTISLPPSPPAPDDQMRYSFVEMLFALAISQIAIHAADLASTTGTTWQMLPATAHLILSFTVIITSWVGWRNSQAPGIKRQIQSIFSKRMVGLIVDVALVIIYFILVRSVEIQQQNGATVFSQPSSHPDAKWICVIFFIYLLWDFFYDALQQDALKASDGKTNSFQLIRVMLASGWASALSLLMAYVVLSYSQQVQTSLTVVFFDAALICVILIFRVLKCFERDFAAILHVEACPAFLNVRPPIPNYKLLTWLLIVLYGLFLGVGIFSDIVSH